MIEDDEKTGKTSASTRATSVESEIDTIHLQSSHPRKQQKTHICLSPPTTEPTPFPIDCLISSSVALCRDQVEQATYKGDGGITTTVYPPHAITVPPPLAERHQDQGGSALDEEEWEIVRIVGSRQRGKGYKYKVC